MGGPARAATAGIHSGPVANADSKLECVFCNDKINTAADDYLNLAGCPHKAHYECFVSANLVRNVRSCPRCKPTEAIADDFGDCINVAHLQLEEFTRRNMEIGMGARVADYNANELLAHATQMVKLDGMTDPQRALALVSAVCAAPPRPLRPWLPNTSETEIAAVRARLSVHTTPANLRMNGVDPLAIVNAGIILDDLLYWNYTLKEIYDIGFRLDTLVVLGFRAAHMTNAAVVSAYDMRNVFKCTFQNIIQIEGKFFKPVGALMSYIAIKLDLEGHTALGLPSLNALRAHHLDRLSLLCLCETLSFADLRALKLDAQMLRDFDMVNAADLRALRGPESIIATAALLKIPIAEVCMDNDAPPRHPPAPANRPQPQQQYPPPQQHPPQHQYPPQHAHAHRRQDNPLPVAPGQERVPHHNYRQAVRDANVTSEFEAMLLAAMENPNLPSPP